MRGRFQLRRRQPLAGVEHCPQDRKRENRVLRVDGIVNLDWNAWLL
jgi:hypothetical protein